jgi:serine protease inhibitor
MLGKALERLIAAVTAAAILTAGEGSVRAESKMTERLASEQAVLASRLIGKLATNNAGANIVISPASLAAALAVIEFGADDRLRRNIHRVLGFSNPATASVDFYGLRAATTQQADKGPFQSANAIFFDRHKDPYPEVIEAMTQAGVRARIEDFTNPATLVAINKWVSEETKGKINSILDRMPSEAGLVALNALYFKDRWKQPFEASETQSAPFHLVGGKAVDTPLMQASDRVYRGRQNDRFVAVELPYASEGYSLVLISTRRGPATAKEFSPVVRWLTGEGFVSSPGEVSLPKFDASASVDLMPTLDAMGLDLPERLPGFTRSPLQLAKVQQRVELTVDEEGTEAAAATAVTATRSLDTSYLVFKGDRPFMFALRDRTGLIIVAGYIANPQSAGPQT